MKPNVFSYHTDIREDAFSRSLGYILNTFPEIGQDLVERLAALSGRSPALFGKFLECEFVGQEVVEGHRTSRPDLKIACSNCSVFVEVKLDSPLSLDQMRRHGGLLERVGDCWFVFVSNLQHSNAELRQLRQYVRPVDRDHFVWADFLPSFEEASGKKSLRSRILADFRIALKAGGMEGRRLKGAEGSLYTFNSDASHLALHQLARLMSSLGFKTIKKHQREVTLRSYPVAIRRHPLLNPRFQPTAADLSKRWNRDCLEISVWAKEAPAALKRRLRKFPVTANLEFLEDGTVHQGLKRLGFFLIPVGFKGRAQNTEIDFESLEGPLKRVLNFWS